MKERNPSNATDVQLTTTTSFKTCMYFDDKMKTL